MESSVNGIPSGASGAQTSSGVCIYTWSTKSKIFEAIAVKLEQAGFRNISVVLLTPKPDELMNLLNGLDNVCDLAFPTVRLNGVLYHNPSSLSNTLESLRQKIDSPKNAQYAYLPPVGPLPEGITPSPVTYLDKEWKWPSIMLNLVETFGVSVEKLHDDPCLPEEFLCDCLRRNLDIESIKACRILIYELLNNGMLEEVTPDEFKFTYHMNYYGLNMNRQAEEDGEDQSPSPIPLSSLIPVLVSKLCGVTQVHSENYLEFLDILELTQRSHFSQFLTEGTRESRLKLLIDLHAILSIQIDDIFKSVLPEDRNKFYINFADRKVHLPEVKKEILMLCEDDVETEGVQSLLALKWTLSGSSEIDDKILKTAAKLVTAVSMKESGGSYVPEFISSDVPKRRSLYSLFISPFI